MARARSFLCLGLLLGAACSAAPGAPAPDLAAAADLGALEGDLADCADPAGERARGGACLRSVSGQVVDVAGAPVRDLTVTTCAELCFYGKTDAQGRFTVEINAYLRTGRYSVLLHGQPRHAAYYLPLLPGAAGVVTLPRPLPLLPMGTEGPAIARDGSAQTLRQGAVTLAIEAGTDIFLSPEDAGGGAVGGRLRPLLVTAPERPPFLDGLPAPLLVYAFGPFEMVLSKPARLAIDNTLGLPAGTALEWLAPRSLQTQPPPGGLVEVIAAGRVSGDGARLEMDEGLKVLTWVLVRQKGS